MKENIDTNADPKLNKRLKAIEATDYYKSLNEKERKALLDSCIVSYANTPVLAEAIAEGFAAMPTKSRLRWHVENFVVSFVATVIGIGTVAVVSSKVGGKAKTDSTAHVGTNDNPFSTDGLEASPRPLRKTAN